MSEPRYLTRKDLARMLEVSVNVIYRNEKRLGLHTARRDLNERVVRYIATEAMRQLQKRGHLMKALVALLLCCAGVQA